MGIGDRTEGELANSEHLNPFVVALWSLRHFGFARHMVAPWALRGRSVVVGIVFIQLCEKSRLGWVLSPSSSLVLSLSG